MALAKIDTERGRRDHDRQAMIAYEALLFPIFLIVALLGRLLPRASAKGGARPSAFAEAADLTESVVPWFFVHR
jgi:hypothetical protein